MATGKLILTCDVTVRDILCLAIRDYAIAAYPPGGSDCAQVARYTLLELATQIETGINATSGSVAISRRPRAMVGAALEYHFDRDDAQRGGGSTHRRALFGELLREIPVDRGQLAAALAADGAGTLPAS